jgi:asparaginyl-tRNA synthetase
MPKVHLYSNKGMGSEKMPFKTLLKAIETSKGITAHTFMVRKVVNENYAVAAKAALKKTVKLYEQNVKKAQKALERSAADAEEANKQMAATQARLEESKAVILTQDTSLPAAKTVRRAYID